MRPLILSLLAIMTTAGTPSTESLTYGVIDAQDHRRSADPALVDAAAAASPELRALAALALGRIGAQGSVPQLVPLLRDPAPAVRLNAGFALGLIGGDKAATAVKARLAAEDDPAVLRQLYLALGRAGTAADLPDLAAGLDHAEAEVRAGAAQGLGLLLYAGDATITVPAMTLGQLLALAVGSGDDALNAAFALTRYKSALTPEQAAQAVQAFNQTANGEAKMQLARVLAKLPSALALPALLQQTSAAALGLRVEVQKALGAFPAEERTLAALRAGLRADDAQVAEQALESVVRLGSSAASLADTVQDLAINASSAWIRGAALEALPAIAPEAARTLADATLKTGGNLVPSALRTLGALLGDDALGELLPYLASSDPKEASAAADALLGFDDMTLAAHAKSDLLAALARHDLALTADVAEIARRAGWLDFAAPLAEAYQALRLPDDLEAKVAVLQALGRVGSPAQVPLLEAALQDDEREVALAAAEAYAAITGLDVMDRVPQASRVRSVTPPLAELRAAAKAQVVLETTRGQVVLRMLDNAPLTVYNFVKLARAGFYDGKSFHRVVPNFVVQGGDPRGDGYGGPGYLIRDEVSPLSHRRGALGIATAGKDTGGCQFFVNHAPNLHLDGVYTVFADVVSGMDVVDRLEVGDVVLKATVVD